MSFFNMTHSITKKQVASYMLLPQVMPRLNQFYQDGFSNLAYLIALVYRAVNIIPEGHAILRRENRHTLGLRQVLGAAAAELQFKKSHIDQIIVYFAILLGIVLLVGQFFITLAFLMVSPADAQTMPTNYGQFFASPQFGGQNGGTEDIAYRLLWSVFGVPEIFRPGGERGEFHVALHSLFQFYSIGLLVVAVIIVCYFIFAILVETAQTGVPFGKRYNHVWTPIRLVFALGLLIPVGYGLNSAQWITLYSAKFGSDFATKGWNLFNSKMNDAFLNNKDERVGTPQAPNLMNLAGNMMQVMACKHAYKKMFSGNNIIVIGMYLVTPAAQGNQAQSASSYSFEQAQKLFKNGDIHIRFGEHDDKKHAQEAGNVYPYCGEMVIPSADATEPGSKSIQSFYYKLVVEMFQTKYDLFKYGKGLVEKHWTGPDKQTTYDEPPSDYKATTADAIRSEVTEAIKKAVKEQAESETWKKDQQQMEKYGWGGAGIWYNKIAQINGSLVTAVNNIPEMRQMPTVAQFTQNKKLQENTEQGNLLNSLMLAGGREIQYNASTDVPIALALAAVNEYWAGKDADQSKSGSQTKVTGNFLIDTINLIFGTRGLFNMCANADIHPLAQLSILGKGLIEATIRNLGGALLLSVGSVMGGALGAAMSAASSMLMSVGMITLTMGFMLFYVLPFLPFLYFFFAVGGWVKGLFEAMVGVPLWALAFLRIDGEGLPGDAAADGIYLIFEIFLRPILIIFGLLASIVIFSALVKVLNDIFSLVVSNLSGHDGTFTQLCGKAAGNATGDTTGGNSANSSAIQYFRGPIDELFFTVIYAIIVYMIGMSCFKLIDLVPNNLLRYMGKNVQTFNDAQSDPAEGLMMKLTAATGQVSSKILGGKDSIVGSGTQALTKGFTGVQADMAALSKPPGGGAGQ